MGAELRDATPLRDDPEALRARIVEDGYLFLPQLLDPDLVTRTRHAALTALSEHGWLADGSDPLEARPAKTPRIIGDDDSWGGYTAILGLEDFNRIPHQPALKAAASAVLGDDLMVQPMKIARVTYPESEYPTNSHQDFFFVRGATDTLTSWVPLGPCPRELGGLQVLRGSHVEGLRSVQPKHGAGGIAAVVDEDDPRWTAPHDYEAGDVLLFHSLTVHRAPANRGDRLRLSGDFRFQSINDPIVAGALFPHSFEHTEVPYWGQLARDWSSTEWIEVPGRVKIAPPVPDPDAVPTSRLIPVPA